MAQHFTFSSKPNIHAGLPRARGRKRRKSDKDGLTVPTCTTCCPALDPGIWALNGPVDDQVNSSREGGENQNAEPVVESADT